jgi:hypothetical protein
MNLPRHSRPAAASPMPKPSRDSTKGDGFSFENPVQHTIESFDRLTAQARQQAIPSRDVLMLAEELLSHGHPDTPRMTALLRQNPHRDIVAHADLLDRCFGQLRAHLHIEDVGRNQIVRAYRKDGYLLHESAGKSRKLLVVFTTIYNNFYISHLNLHAMLKDLGCHLLLLKESTLANFQRGVPSFADDMPGIADQIRATARKLGADQIYLSGFSSSGYAALLTSLRLACHGYLGFSHSTDLSPGSPLGRPSYFSDEIYARLDPRWLLDLRPELEKADPAIPRVLVYGDRTKRDGFHAAHLAGLNTIRLLRLRGATHNSIQYLLGRGRLTAAFRRLVADR